MRSKSEIIEICPTIAIIDMSDCKDGDDGFACRVGKWGQSFVVISSWGMGWDHVSVSHSRRCPSWEEMEWIKRIFFNDGEVAFQLHVPANIHINVHPNCLHLWRPQNVEIPTPELWMV